MLKLSLAEYPLFVLCRRFFSEVERMANKKPLLIAIIFGIIAVVLVYAYMRSIEKEYAQKESEIGTVVIAARTIQVREVIKEGMVTESERPVEYIPQNAYTELDEVLGKVSTQTIIEGGPLFPDQFKEVDEIGDLALHLNANERAVTIGVTEIVAVGGNVKTGDHVDVLATFEGNDEVGAPTTVTILLDIRVAAVGTDIGTDIDEGGGTGISKSITLAVTPNEAEILALVSENASIRLSLRPLDEKFAPQTLGVTISDVIRYRPTREDLKNEAQAALDESRRREQEAREDWLKGLYAIEDNGDGGEVIQKPPWLPDLVPGPKEVTVELINGGESEDITVPESLYSSRYSVFPRTGYRFNSMYSIPYGGQ